MVRHLLFLTLALYFWWGIHPSVVYGTADSGSFAVTFVPLRHIVKGPGKYTPSEGLCLVSLEIHSMGGDLALSVPSERLKPIRDITGVAWVAKTLLIFSVGPIYGKPGIYTLDCNSSQATRIVAPKTFSKAYPDGSDYFELEGFSETDSNVVRFYYTSDVDSVDARRLRGNEFLYQTAIDGTDLKKVHK